MRRALRSSGCHSRTRDNREGPRGVPPGRRRLRLASGAHVRVPLPCEQPILLRKGDRALHEKRIARGSTMVRWAALAGALALADGCTWVKLTPPGEGVHVGTAAEAASCEKLGATHSKTSSRVLFF